MSNLDEKLTKMGEKICERDISLSEAGDLSDNLEPIGRGEGRTVLRIRRNISKRKAVVKFAHSRSNNRGGIDQNKYESFLWRNSSKDEKEHLAPVIRSHENGLWLIMQYANPVPEHIDLEPKRDELYETFGSRIDTTFRRRNFGLIQNDIKLIDYGYPMQT